MKELEATLRDLGAGDVDFITLVGDGEPTLSLDMGTIIREIKKRWEIPVAVITNGSLLFKREVREELHQADVVLPTLDAGTPETFVKINRPNPAIRFREMVEGMVRFREEFPGEVWMEFMLVEGLNDSDEELVKVKDVLEGVGAHRNYVNVPIRPPAESWVELPDEKNFQRVCKFLGDFIFLNFREDGRFHLPHVGQVDESHKEITKAYMESLLEIIKRHPLRFDQALETLRKDGVLEPEKVINDMILKGLVKHRNHQGTKFLVTG